MDAWKRIMCASDAAEQHADQEEAPLASAEVMAEIDEVVERIGTAGARDWLAAERETLRMSQAGAERALQKLRDKLPKPAAA